MPCTAGTRDDAGAYRVDIWNHKEVRVETSCDDGGCIDVFADGKAIFGLFDEHEAGRRETRDRRVREPSQKAVAHGSAVRGWLSLGPMTA